MKLTSKYDQKYNKEVRIDCKCITELLIVDKKADWQNEKECFG